MAFGKVGKYVRVGAAVAGAALAKGAASGISHIAKRGLLSGASWMQRKYRGRGKRSGRAQRPITGERDYRSTVMRRGGNRSMRKFRAKVRAALAADAPRQIYTTLLKQAQVDAGGILNVNGIYLGDLDTTTQGDIWNIFKDAYGLTTVADAENRKIHLMSMAQELQMRNLGTDQCQVSIYTLQCRNDLDLQTDFTSNWITWFADMSTVGAVSNVDAALTPFHVPTFLRYWKILAKNDHLIKPGEVVSVVQRKRVNRVIQGRTLQDIGGARAGLTRAFFWTVKGVPANTAATSGLTGFNLAISNQNSYFYKNVVSDVATDTIGQTR